MIAFYSILCVSLLTFATRTVAKTYQCGEISVIMTGLPPYHPLVAGTGFTGEQVEAAMMADSVNILKAGYNFRAVLMGPEKGTGILSQQINGTKWDGAGIGFGVRGSNRPDVTILFGDIIQVYRDTLPKAPIVFSYSPNSTIWAISRQFPISSDCSKTPGKNLGFNVFCDICSKNTTIGS